MSKASKNEQKRSYRKRVLEKKHFTEPLPVFLETKYPDIFAEYEDLYKTITKQHGKKRIATKTRTFKEWKASVEQQQQHSDERTNTNTIGTQTTTETTSTSIIEQDNEPSRAAQNLMAVGEQQVEVIMPASANEGQEAIQMNLDQLADIMVNVEGQVNDIMAELREDPDLRRIMGEIDNEVDTQPQDEGIDISPLDDILYDIEPFDFRLEVENYNW